MCTPGEQAAGSAAEALAMAMAGLDYLNSPAAGELVPAALGGVLAELGVLQAKLTAARAEALRRFDAADAHDADGYGSSGRWLAAMTGMTRRGARAAVAEMRQLREHGDIAAALAAGDITESLGLEMAEWTNRLPEELRAATDRILLQAAAGGADADDLKMIAVAAYEKWRSQRPDGDDDERRFRDRYLRLGITLGGAAYLRGSLTPECAAALRAVLESLGKKAGPEDNRTQEQRDHDALQLGAELLLRADLVPDRAGADTRADVQIGLSQLRDMPGAAELEDAWLRARAGQDGYLAGKDAETAACDAVIVPVVTGHPDMAVIDQIIAIIAAATGGDGALAAVAGGALRWTVARLAIDFVSGPGGIASVLRTGLLERPYSTPSLPLDIGWSKTIPGSIRRAVILRDRHCAWPRCDRPAAWCDVHHIVHKKDGGETSVRNCALLCQFHHDVCIHRWGWQFVLHPDGSTSAYGPRGQVLHSHHPPPAARAA